MNILVACEESQAVTTELRKLGHNAFSCDLIECSGGHPEWHIKQSVQPLLNGRCSFKTMDGTEHTISDRWDMILAFPPCTYLTVTGNRWFDVVKYQYDAQKRWDNRCVAICFFLSIAYADCNKIAIENPLGVMSRLYRKPDQIIQPWQFALSEEEKTVKSTCLWLKGLQPLTPFIKEKPELAYHKWTTPDGKEKQQSLWYYKTRCLPHSERANAASKTFPGIARAMAEQWGGIRRKG